MSQETQSINTEELHKRAQTLNADEVIVDCRSPSEYQAGHIKGAINCPVDSIVGDADDLKKYKTVYLHCKMGGRASNAFHNLYSLGLRNIVCVQGGMAEWEARGYETVR